MAPAMMPASGSEMLGYILTPAALLASQGFSVFVTFPFIVIYVREIVINDRNVVVDQRRP